MSKLINVARPYAKAIFNLAIEHKTIEQWQLMLEILAKISINKQILKLSPNTIIPNKLANIFIMICDNNIDIYGQNLIKIMSKHRRLMALPEVLQHFNYLCAAWKSIINVEIISARLLKKDKLNEIINVIEYCLSSKIKLNHTINKLIIAGIIIRIGDIIIDGSIHGRFKKLTSTLLQH